MRVRNDYYKVLEDVQRCRRDETAWFLWFVACIHAAIDHSADLISGILMRAEFWNKYHQIDLNAHQKKVITHLLEAGPGGFEGGLTTRKYAAIAKVSRATAYREINDLMKKEVLRQPEGKGRSVHYEPAWPGSKP